MSWRPMLGRFWDFCDTDPSWLILEPQNRILRLPRVTQHSRLWLVYGMTVLNFECDSRSVSYSWHWGRCFFLGLEMSGHRPAPPTAGPPFFGLISTILSYLVAPRHLQQALLPTFNELENLRSLSFFPSLIGQNRWWNAAGAAAWPLKVFPYVQNLLKDILRDPHHL